jgi:hypothetical protein
VTNVETTHDGLSIGGKYDVEYIRETAELLSKRVADAQAVFNALVARRGK